MDIDEMLAREGIRYTIGLYNSIGDRGAYDELTSVYTTEGRWILNDGTVVEPLARIIEMSRAGAERRGAFDEGTFQRHLLGHSVINVVDAEKARSLHYVLIYTELGPDHAAVYRDDWRKVGDRWLLAQRINALEWIRPDSRFKIYGDAAPMAPEHLDLGFQLPSSGRAGA
jgi:hypothetical protein